MIWIVTAIAWAAAVALTVLFFRGARESEIERGHRRHLRRRVRCRLP